jgi:predicted transcriptional regulator YdeE
MSNQPTLVYRKDISIAGVSVRTINRDEFNPETAKLGVLWEKFRTQNILSKIPEVVPNSPVYGVYSDYESDATGYYTVTAGVEIKSTLQLGTNFTQVTIPEGQYLLFSGKGSMPEVVVNVWRQVWDYFSKDSPYKRRFKGDFELYTSADEVAIYIGVLL